MSGGLTIALAKAMPDRVAAVASIHGAWIVTDDPDSSHLDLDAVTAEIYMGWADNDATAPPDTSTVMRKALEQAGVPAHDRLPPRRRPRLRPGGHRAVQPGRRRSSTGSGSTHCSAATLPEPGRDGGAALTALGGP